ncbi:carboxypeptidase-like regulatory domain-containing protein [Siphonobacter sp. BAB-5385]|uniref:carboxypeptidase-like regulatory domain-containing protein n=1 Tax=Siphonobacter sp. BAB-5385 TaxID=1864822 RepID=UPI0020CC0376|nr:carboxypeptidase-like regulatory domain-containing protein [Siphonobacter sp. BAB-5385]
MKKTLPICLWAGLTMLPGIGISQTFARAETLRQETKAPAYRSLRKVLQEIKTQYKVDILFENRVVDPVSIPVERLKSHRTAEQALRAILYPAGLTYQKVKENAYVVTPEEKSTPATTPPRTSFVMPSVNATTPLLSLLHATPSADIPVRGTVRDEATGEGLPGVNVIVKGTSKGATTDATGTFRLDIPDDNAILVFSSIGYQTQELAVGTQTVLNISMKATDQALNEVVVVGYGEQKKESITGAISTISSKDIEKVHGGSTVSSGLAGKIPGVSFRMTDGRPGSSANIQIRNMGNPLYVIDGIQKDAGQFNNISPNDIESITVLKDASAAIYGVRAANGVIVVTTKRGKMGNPNTINVDAYTGVQNWTRFPRTTNAYEWMLGKADAK